MLAMSAWGEDLVKLCSVGGPWIAIENIACTRAEYSLTTNKAKDKGFLNKSLAAKWGKGAKTAAQGKKIE